MKTLISSVMLCACITALSIQGRVEAQDVVPTPTEAKGQVTDSGVATPEFKGDGGHARLQELIQSGKADETTPKAQGTWRADDPLFKMKVNIPDTPEKKTLVFVNSPSGNHMPGLAMGPPAWQPFETEEAKRVIQSFVDTYVDDGYEIPFKVLSPDGHHVAIGTQKDRQTSLHLFEMRAGMKSVGHFNSEDGSTFVALKWAPCGSRLAVIQESHSGNPNVVRFLGVGGLDKVFDTEAEHIAWIWDGELITAEAGCVNVLNTQTMRISRRIKLKPDEYVHRLLMNSGHDQLIVALKERIMVFDTKNEFSHHEIPCAQGIESVALSDSGRLLAVAEESGHTESLITVYETAWLKPVVTQKSPAVQLTFHGDDLFMDPERTVPFRIAGILTITAP